MTRDTQIPLFLWIATAVVVHLLWGGGADRVANVVAETVEIREFAASVRRFVRGENKPVEVALLDDQSAPDKPDPAAPEEPQTKPAEPDQKSAAEDEEAPPAEPKHVEKEEKKPPEPPKKPEEKKPEPPVKTEEKKVEEVEKIPPPEDLKRVAVRQHVEDPNQADNPNAEFIGDQANHVKEQTQAKITSADQNDPTPTPGGAAQPSKDSSDPGNADTTRVAESEDRPGEKDRAPGVKPAPSELRITQAPAPAPSPAAAGQERRQEGAPKLASRASTNSSRLPAQQGAEAQPALKAAEAVPDTLDSAQGGWEVPGERAASIEQPGRPARKKRSLPPLRSSSATDLLGLGGTGRTPGGVNLNLSPQIAVAAIGRDTLVRELKADGERRRSQHAGRWRPVGIERWRAAIENYVASVKPGNQTALNTARVPFASYLNQIHLRIHPLFAESFLDSLDDLPSTHPMNRPDIATNLEIVLDRDEGRIQRMGITKTSGVTAFDVAALEAVHRAQPFGTPPREIVSPDGNVYFHWEFHRNREEACSTYFARPFILKGQPKSAPPPTPEPERPPASEEEGRERHGKQERRSDKPLALAHAAR
ncbi:MAG TPA: TonB C-terminal domain-containing protein [Polyangiaceae bacterium]